MYYLILCYTISYHITLLHCTSGLPARVPSRSIVNSRGDVLRNASVRVPSRSVVNSAGESGEVGLGWSAGRVGRAGRSREGVGRAGSGGPGRAGRAGRSPSLRRVIPSRDDQASDRLQLHHTHHATTSKKSVTLLFI